MTENQGEKTLRGAGGWRQRTGLLASGLVVLALCLAVRHAGPPPGAAAAGKEAPSGKKSAKQPAYADDSRPPESTAKEKPGVVAVVNGEPITREKLGEECLKHFGAEVLDTLVSKQLIVEHCKARGVEVTHAEVRAEIDHMAERFGLPTDQLLKMLKDERHITPNQYAKEIIWPTVALRKLAAKELQVTDKEINDAYDVLYGPSVQTRLISCKTAEEANKVRALAVEDPDDFPNLAMKYSHDRSAGSKGLIQPIHKHEGPPEVERAAFGLKVGGISPVIKVAQDFVILKCEAHLPAQGVPKDEVRDQLIESIRDTKLRGVAENLFKRLKDEGDYHDVFKEPAMRKRHPGVAAIIEGHEITMRELAEDCIDRHGIEVLEAMISHRLLEQACRKKKITVSPADVQAEIERSAIAAGCITKKKKTGNAVADVAAWLQDVKEHQGLTEEIYRQEVAWPAAALKKLVGKDVEITDEDMHKSYEANYGKRVRCRAILFDRERKAHQVWTALRDQRSRIEQEYPAKNERDERNRLTLDEFAKAAGQYSVDRGSREVQGQIPPIARYGTDPLMEKEAFALKAHEMSGVIQVADKYVILYCEGFTKPAQTTFDEVKQEITADLREKKMRVAIAQQYAKLNDLAQIDNFLTGTSKTPESGNGVDKLLGGTGLLAEPAPTDEPPRRKPPAKTVNATPGNDTTRR